MEEKESGLFGLLSKIAVIATAVSVSTFAIGCFIINVNLSSYQLQDFDLLKPRAVYVGLVYIAILITNVVIYLKVPDRLKKLPINERALNRHNVLKCGLAVLVFYFIFESDLATNEFCVYNFFGYTVDAKVQITSALFLCLIFYQITSDGELKEITHRIAFWITFSLIFALVILFLRVTEFQSILFLQALICLFTHKLHFKIGKKTEAEIKQITDGGFPDEDEPKKELIEKEIDKKQKDLKENFDRVEIPALITMGIFIFLVMTYIYSHFFYERIPQFIGGGKLESIKYIIDKDTISGKKIYETENFVFVLMKDKAITKLNWADINKIVTK